MRSYEMQYIKIHVLIHSLLIQAQDEVLMA